MIYLDNGATGGFKPNAVYDAFNSAVRYLSANPGRSGHRLSVTGAELVYSARETLADFFGGSPEEVAFTKNCTEALNLAIFGTLKRGGHVITTVYEHNSVLRPLSALAKEGIISLDIVSPDKNKTILSAIEEKINDNTYLIVTTALSNVTGTAMPISEIADVAKKYNLLYLVDGAQGAGHIPLSLSQGISMLAVAGHKGLYGIMGSGALIFKKGLHIEPILYGGTGTESFNLIAPLAYPDKLEAGTLNLPAISALKEGVKYVKANFNTFREYLYTATARLISELNKLAKVKCYSTPNDGGIVSFEINGLSSAEVADILNSKFDIAVRGGLHCAPLIHKYLGTDESGLVRASIAVQNSSKELNYFTACVNKIASGNY